MRLAIRLTGRFATGLGIVATGLLVSGCADIAGHGDSAARAPNASLTQCAVSAADQAWLDRSLQAWHFARTELAGLDPATGLTMVVFDAECALTSRDAMTGSTTERPGYESVTHDGSIRLPDGETMPPAVTSFTNADGEEAYFAMSLPSVWEAGGVLSDPLGLPDLMTAVLLHEAIHVSQFPTYGGRVTALAERERLPDTFNDDSVQEQFEHDAAFAASIVRETELLLAAAAAPDDRRARRFARQARELMAVRRAAYFVGDDAYLAEAQDLWLTLEGSGQWVGMAWLLHPAGGGRTEADAMTGFGQRSKWWTQKLGLALVLAIDRLGADWKPVVFGSAERTVVQILDDLLGAGP